MEKPGTPSSEQSDKAKKYDRQLRLWGDHGQSSLECAHVCLISASAVGTETLKSLVLPGIGAITIIDDAKVSPKDIGNNFFVDGDSVGRPRGEVALQLLLELNPDVRGTFVDQPLQEILDNQPDFFSPFSVVIATCLPERERENERIGGVARLEAEDREKIGGWGRRRETLRKDCGVPGEAEVKRRFVASEEEQRTSEKICGVQG
ncbi:NEDD8-activating enzyme E1 regulatory subunit-like [Macrobrachium nipponense]|uniref:NEDD8-activating enzyme E1 regulatory subunit-like n=1 Tax=Macrobrachium nipponense TaxID=159736 RepID=UPI0030C8A8BB